MRLFIFALAIVFSSGSFVQAQKKFTNPAKAKQLKEKHEDVDVVALSSASTYVFEINDENLQITQKDKVNLITLQSNVKYRRPIFYNDNVQVRNGGVKYSSGRGILKSNKVCGNYEVEDVFYSDAKVCAYFFDILYEASEVTFNSEKIYDDPKYLTKVFFHEQDPVESKKITFRVPDGINVEFVEMNFDGFEIEKSIVKEGGNQIYTYKIKNIDELKPESNSLGFLHYYPHLVIVTKDYATSSGLKPVISSVDDLYDWYSDLVNQVDSDPDIFSNQVKKLTANAKTDEEKIKNTYYWVQENIKYIAFEDGIAGFKPETPQKVFENRYGDCKGMAILTKAMLVEAGFDARLTWIGTNKIPYNYDIPSFAVDNHMICTLLHNDKQYILDATEKYIALGEHAERIQGKEMLIENGNEFIRKFVPVEDSKKNLVLRSEKLHLEGETLVGQGELEVKGESKKMILYFSTNSKVEDKDELFDYLSVSEYNNDDMVEVKNIPEMDRDQPLVLKYNYKLNNRVSSFDKEIYIEMDWEKTYGDLNIKDDRFSDYYFGRKVHNKVVKTLELPKGYKISHLPESIEEKYKDISISINFKQKDNSVIYSNEIIIESGMILKDDFEIWNGLIQKIEEVYNDQIVITKIS